jgi:hypothetical protein
MAVKGFVASLGSGAVNGFDMGLRRGDLAGSKKGC